MAETLETATTTDWIFEYGVPIEFEFSSDTLIDVVFDSDSGLDIDFVIINWTSADVDFGATTLALGEDGCDPWVGYITADPYPSPDAETPVVPDLA